MCCLPVCAVAATWAARVNIEAGVGCDWRLLDTMSVETWKLEIQPGYSF